MEKKVIEDYVTLVIFLFLFVMLGVQVFCRYLFNYPIGWINEIGRYLLIIITFIGLGGVTRRDSNIRLLFLLESLPKQLSNIIKIFLEIIEIVFLVFSTWYAWQLFLFMRERIMTSFPISLKYLYGPVFVGLLCATIRCLQRLIYKYKGIFLIS